VQISKINLNCVGVVR